jgi:hypothetical protein
VSPWSVAVVVHCCVRSTPSASSTKPSSVTLERCGPSDATRARHPPGAGAG